MTIENDSRMTAKSHKTMTDVTERPTDGQTERLSEEKTGARQKDWMASSMTGEAKATFVLGGKIYQEVRTLSQSSGEAQVLLVRNGDRLAVLKLYYPGYVPEEGVLQVVWNMDFELVVRLFDYGHTVVGGVLREYELMEWLEGISLADYSLREDFAQFRRIALSAAASLAFCHNYGLIHKDVKLGNFLFRDKECTNLVLTDFGISTLVGEEETLHRTTQARTPLYAAPEMYDNVIDGEVELTPKADYYSLGIVLFFLWLGKNPFSGNERSMMRLKSEGKLPNLDSLPDNVRRLVRGLTVVNPEKRWGYNEVERWFKGEEVEIDESSIYLKYKSFIVDSEKNVLAANAQELAEALGTRKHLGIKYLYGKLISAWLEECGNRKMAVELDDIVDKRYPHDPEAGFQAALYTLDNKLPYTDSKGNVCTNVHEVVMAMLSNMNDYKVRLQDPHHPLYIYLEMTTELEVGRLKEYFSTDNPDIAFWRMIFEIDDTVPFLPDKPSGTIDEIVCSFADMPCSDDQWLSLTDGRLLSWLYYKCDPLVYVELKEIYDRHLPHTRSQAYRVLYKLKKGVGFDLHDATTRTQVAMLMGEALVRTQFLDEEEFCLQMAEFIDSEGRLLFYADICGWRDVAALHRMTFDLHASQHTNRYGVYDIRTAAYRFCAALGAVPVYYLRSNGQIIGTLEQYRAMDVKLLRDEMDNGCLKQWLTVFFHENPMESFDEKYSYEQALADYLQEVGHANPDDIHYRRFRQACEEGRQMLVTSRMRSSHIHRREKMLSGSFIGLSVLLCLLLLCFGYSNPTLFLAEAPFAVGLPVGGMLMLVAASWSYFHGNGILGTLLYGLFGAAIGLLPVWLLRGIGDGHPHWLAVCSVLMVLGCMGCAMWMGQKKFLYRYGDLKPLMQENIHSTLLDPLYFTYRQRSSQFKGSTYKTLEDAIAVMNATRVELFVHYLLWIGLVLVLTLLFVAFHADLFDVEVPDTTSLRNKLNELFKMFFENESPSFPYNP